MEPAPTRGNPRENQTNISAVVSNVNCFGSINAMQASLPNDASTAAYGVYDTGSNKTLISRKFQRKFGLLTRQQFVTLNGLGSSFSGQRDVVMLNLKAIVDPQMLKPKWWILYPSNQVILLISHMLTSMTTWKGWS